MSDIGHYELNELGQHAVVSHADSCARACFAPLADRRMLKSPFSEPQPRSLN